MTKFSLHHFDEKDKDESESTSNSKLKSFKSAIPFLALIVFIFVAGGIFYSVERNENCRKAPTTKYSNYTVQNESESIFGTVEAKNVSLLEMIKRFSRNIEHDQNMSLPDNISTIQEENKDRFSYWSAVHFVATTITTIGTVLLQ